MANPIIGTKGLKQNPKKTTVGVKDVKQLERQADGRMPQSNDVKVLKGSADPRQLRCKQCGNLATNIPDGKGGTMLSCTSCGARYRTYKL
jgi:hypothetical protein